MKVVMLLYPGLTQLDLTGPHEVWSRFTEFDIVLAWKTLAPVTADSGVRLVPDATLAECPQADIIFVPGGPGQAELMADEEVLGFLRKQAQGAQWITSVCTGSLVLAAAGLLQGYRATCHWLSVQQLGWFGAEPVSERVVFDRNRVTGAGVTSGMDFALAVAARLLGAERAQAAQLQLEYDPQPPFTSGSPRTAPPEVLEAVRRRSAAFQSKREALARIAAGRLGHSQE